MYKRRGDIGFTRFVFLNDSSSVVAAVSAALFSRRVEAAETAAPTALAAPRSRRDGGHYSAMK
jgi:hypothetical protein